MNLVKGALVPGTWLSRDCLASVHEALGLTPQHHTHKTGKQTKRDLMYLQSLRLLEKGLAAFFGSSASAETSCALQLSLDYSGHEFFPSSGCGVSTRSPGSILCLRALIIS